MAAATAAAAAAAASLLALQASLLPWQPVAAPAVTSASLYASTFCQILLLLLPSLLAAAPDLLLQLLCYCLLLRTPVLLLTLAACLLPPLLLLLLPLLVWRHHRSGQLSATAVNPAPRSIAGRQTDEISRCKKAWTASPDIAMQSLLLEEQSRPCLLLPRLLASHTDSTCYARTAQAVNSAYARLLVPLQQECNQTAHTNTNTNTHQ
jgi:hypothetical protein